MPIPTADIYDREQQQNAQSSSTSTSNHTSNGISTSESNPSDSGIPSNTNSASSNNEGERTLSREEADRLYEERMEEEYARREEALDYDFIDEV
ncbi:uncharacterized protein N7483_004545 [Penicillium malachiteum]|uniref:uncharacterized protein n=1 Tax=Penicillium malachiteum TaxID=1324776 RepID=UPI0025486C43|nr:uncharacterized protein N7483_004545 [Penicillium malachiteum]KAJ5730037.1 hypothetical protein N7483_004545 [Penicillium malachiteum]